MRTISDVNKLITRLKSWRDRRAEISQSPERVGRPLRNDELDEAILYLTEYRGMLTAETEVQHEALG